MFDNVLKFFKKFSKGEKKESKFAAKERLHLVLMQDRANVSADFMELMKQEIIEVIKKYIDVDENSIDVKLSNKINADGTTGAPMLYANIPIVSVKDEAKQVKIERKNEKSNKVKKDSKKENKKNIEEKNKAVNEKKEEAKDKIKNEINEKDNSSENINKVEEEKVEIKPKQEEENSTNSKQEEVE